jgi:hypothetical protein
MKILSDLFAEASAEDSTPLHQNPSSVTRAGSTERELKPVSFQKSQPSTPASAAKVTHQTWSDQQRPTGVSPRIAQIGYGEILDTLICNRTRYSVRSER